MFQFLVQQHPDAVKGKNSQGRLPLHVACTKKQSLEVIRLLVSIYPNTVKEKERQGWLPLHAACVMKQSLEVIQFLVQQHPQALKEKENNGMTPLDFAKMTIFDQTRDPKTVEWLEAVNSGRIILPAMPISPPRRDDVHVGADGTYPSSAVVEKDLTKLPTASSNVILPKLIPAPPRRDQGKANDPCPWLADLEKDGPRAPHRRLQR